VTTRDLLAALEPVVAAFEALSVPYYVGGSVASSAHGVPRASIDADIVAELDRRHVKPLVSELGRRYYVAEGHVQAAVEARRSFNVIHLETMFKIDVFVSKGRPFDREAMERARSMPLDDAESSRSFRLASVEDTLVAKLEWFRAGGESSDRQWADIVGLLRTWGDRFDLAYASRWASALGLSDLLARAVEHGKA
jgi:hypothetical protein